MLMDKEENIQHLIKQLDSDHYFLCEAAVHTLGCYGDSAKSAVPALINRLKTCDDRLLLEIVVALGKIGEASAFHALSQVYDRFWPYPSYDQTLISDLNSNRALRRLEVINALKKIGSFDTIPVLIKALDDPSWDIQSKVRETLQILLDGCQDIQDFQKFEDKLDETFTISRDKLKGKRQMELELRIMKLKIKIADKRNELSGTKDIISKGKPIPPKRGEVFKHVRRAHNG
jgi:hypothetical protein